MKIEIRRQLVHISGIIFVFLAQYIGQIIVFYFFAVALTLLLYSQIILKELERANILTRLESKIRNFTMKFEREQIPRPFVGAIWFFFSLGLTFLVFPLPIASAAGFMLSIGDGLSTLVGKHFGRIKTIGQKTLEGTAALFLGSLTAALFVPLPVAALGALAAAIAELMPEIAPLARLRNRGLLDDNLLVPLLGGAVVLLAIAFIP